ncbi:MAG: hypothetical protein OSB55_11130 [Verrucomicrobiota bacterium]|nr:hypothetical protein [Verrucomicrobiota bacterium]
MGIILVTCHLAHSPDYYFNNLELIIALTSSRTTSPRFLLGQLNQYWWSNQSSNLLQPAGVIHLEAVDRELALAFHPPIMSLSLLMMGSVVVASLLAIVVFLIFKSRGQFLLLRYLTPFRSESKLPRSLVAL